MTDGLVLVGVRIPKELKNHLDSDHRPNQKVVTDALRRELGDEEQVRIKQKLEELDRRIVNIQSEKSKRERKLEELTEERGRLEKLQQEKEDRREQYAEDCLDAIGHLPDDPANPAVDNWADKAGIDNEEFYEMLTQVANDA